MNVFTIIVAVLWANAVTAAVIFVFVRLRQKDAFDAQSLGALAFACAVGITSGYLMI